MSWTHSSKILTLGVLLAIALGMAGTAAAFGVNDSGVPDEMEVGETESVTIVLEEPFEQRDPGWTLEAETGFDDPTVTIRAETPTTTFTETGDASVDMTLDEEAISEVEIEVTGEVPAIEDYDYENKDAENFDVVALSADGAPIANSPWEVHRYTQESKDARQKIDEAHDRGGDDADLTSAISLYNSEDFQQAIAEAEEVIDDAESEEQTQQLLLYGGIVIVLIALAGGGYYAYSQRKEDTNKLQ